MARTPLVAAAFAGLALGLLASRAEANGRFPAAGHIAVDPSDPSHLLVRTTYGLLTTRDGGEAWDWICEQAVGWTGQYDPTITVTADGSFVVGTYDHLAVAHGDSCGWLRPAPLDGKDVVDVSTDKKTPSTAIAMTSKVQGSSSFVSELWESLDDGETWTVAGAPLPTDFRPLTVDTAPSNPMRVYASGLYGAGGAKGGLARSLDRGATWEVVDVPSTDADHAPYIGAVDPNDEKRLYVRLFGTPGRLFVSTDGGDSFTELFTGTGLLKGLALSPDGATLLVGGESDGVHRVTTATSTVEKVADVGVQCLAWGKNGVLACAAEAKDGFTIGLSVDEGGSFTSALHLPCVRGPLDCASDTSVGSKCPAAWPATADIIDQKSCYPTEPADAGADAGQPDAGGAGAAPPAADDSGCQAGPGAGSFGALLAASGLAFFLMRRRVRG